MFTPYSDKQLLQYIKENKLEELSTYFYECMKFGLKDYIDLFWRRLPTKNPSKPIPFFILLIHCEKFEIIKHLLMYEGFEDDVTNQERVLHYSFLHFCSARVKTEKDLNILQRFLCAAIDKNPGLLIPKNLQGANSLYVASKPYNPIMVRFLLQKFLQHHSKLEGKFLEFFYHKTPLPSELSAFDNYYGIALSYDSDACRTNDDSPFRTPAAFHKAVSENTLVQDIRYWELYFKEIIAKETDPRIIYHWLNLTHYHQHQTPFTYGSTIKQQELIADIIFYLKFLSVHFDKEQHDHRNRPLNRFRRSLHYTNEDLANNYNFMQSVNLLFFLVAAGTFIYFCIKVSDMHEDVLITRTEFRQNFPDYPYKNNPFFKRVKPIRNCRPSFDSIPAIADCNNTTLSDLCSSFEESYKNCHRLLNRYHLGEDLLYVFGFITLLPLMINLWNTKTLNCSHGNSFQPSWIVGLEVLLLLLIPKLLSKLTGKYIEYVPNNKTQLFESLKLVGTAFYHKNHHNDFDKIWDRINLQTDEITYKEISAIIAFFQEIIVKYTNDLKYTPTAKRISEETLGEIVDQLKLVRPIPSRTKSTCGFFSRTQVAPRELAELDQAMALP